MRSIETDIAIVGGGTGGVAAALAAARSGHRVVLTEQYDWLGGQFTSQAVPPDEHLWVEQFGVTESYRELRNRIREEYRRSYPLTTQARGRVQLNPGGGLVSKLCHEPRVAVMAIDAMLAPFLSRGLLTVLQPFLPVAVDATGDRITSVVVAHRDSGEQVEIHAKYVLDATETGDLLPLASAEYVTGFESQAETGEPSAPVVAQPLNMQAITYCFAVDHVDGDHTIDQPEMYDFWHDYEPPFWGSPLLSWSAPDPQTLEPTTRDFDPNASFAANDNANNAAPKPADKDLWLFRRILARENFAPGAYASDIVLVNWPQIDYFRLPIIEAGDSTKALWEAKQLSLSMLYWMQTEAPRADGGTGFPSLRLRPDIVGTDDGLAQAPYIRESRRIHAEYRIVEQDLSLAIRGDRGAVRYSDSVGIGMYRIDLHPSTGGDNYIDVGSSPFQIPLGALIPVRLDNLLPAAKNIGTTHITNGSYRLHPVEWNIGEVAGELASHCIESRESPRAVRNSPRLLADFQRRLQRRGVEIAWPRVAGY